MTANKLCPGCFVPHRAETRLCPFCEVTRVHECLKAFGTAMVVAGLVVAWAQADEYAARMEYERNDALGWPAPGRAA